MPVAPPGAVLWDADGVLQDTLPAAWTLAVRVVGRFPGALTGAPIDEPGIRAAARELGLADRVEEIVSVWTDLDVRAASLDVLARVRAAGTPCYLATNQDAWRAECMRGHAAYRGALDGGYYSCDLGVAKPSAGFFVHIAADLSLAPAALLFLDDQPANVAAARAAGLRAERWTHEDGTQRLCARLAGHGVALDAAVPTPGPADRSGPTHGAV